MKWKRIIGLVVLLGIIAAVFVRLIMNKETTEQRVYHYDKSKAITVQMDTISLQLISNPTESTGTFEPDKETKISAEVQGKINSVLVDVGSHVKKGQSLIQLDNAMLKLQLQSAELQIEGLQKDVDRYTILSEADAIQGIQLEKASLGLRSAKVQRATLLEQINKTTIKAPFDGVVTAKFGEEGAFAAPGVPLLQITDIMNLRFTVNVPEYRINLYETDKTVSIVADIYPDAVLSGKVIMVGSKSNMGSSFPVQMRVTNTKNLSIKSGMLGRVKIKSDNPKKGIIIPTSAIITTENQPQVYKVLDGKAVLHNITIAENIKNRTVVANGLNEGDVIVTGGFINLFDGAKVETIRN